MLRAGPLVSDDERIDEEALGDPLCRRAHIPCVRRKIVAPTDSEHSGRVFRSAESSRPIAASISVVGIALLVVGLVYATTGPTVGDAGGSAAAADASHSAAARLPTPTVTAAAAGRPALAPASTTNPAVRAVGRQRSATEVAPVTTAVPPSVDAGAHSTSSTHPIESAASPIGPIARPVVVLYGDSLAWEARDSFNDSFADHPHTDVYTRTFGGTAICDWLDQMAADAASLAPGIVVIEFSGNSFTECMHDANGVALTGAAIDERYAVDAASAIEIFASIGTHVVFAGAPVFGPNAATGGGRLNSLYRELGDDHDGVWYTDAGRSVLDGDSYTITLPCLSSEPCGGGYTSDGLLVNVVRNPDGVHFCPVSGVAVQGVTDDCPEWSSGAYRYGRALAQPVLDALAVSSFG